MTTAAISPPSSHSGTESTVGFPYVFADVDIEQALLDRLDVMGLGLVRLVGDFAGSGSDTMRVKFIDGVGFDNPMDALASETDSIVPSSFTLGYSEVSLGMYGLGYSDTYKAQLLSAEPAALLDYLKSTIPDSGMATLRSLVCTAGSGFSSSVGATSTRLSMDDWLDLLAAWRSTMGARRPKAVLHSAALNQLVESARSEPAFQSSLDAFSGAHQVQESQLYPGAFGLPIDIVVTNDVVQSGGAYKNFAHQEGGIGWAAGDTSRIKVSGINPIYIPRFGLLIQDLTEGAGQMVRQSNGIMFVGVAAGDPSVFFERVVNSVV